MFSWHPWKKKIQKHFSSFSTHYSPLQSLLIFLSHSLALSPIIVLISLPLSLHLLPLSQIITHLLSFLSPILPQTKHYLKKKSSVRFGNDWERNENNNWREG